MSEYLTSANSRFMCNIKFPIPSIPQFYPHSNGWPEPRQLVILSCVFVVCKEDDDKLRGLGHSHNKRDYLNHSRACVDIKFDKV